MGFIDDFSSIQGALPHGGDLAEASRRFGVAEDSWLDLSTGISPWSWPVPQVPEAVWRRLPDSSNGLEKAAAEYYGCALEMVLAVPGTQFGLQQIPTLFSAAPVAVPAWGYGEHRAAWQRAGHRMVEYENLAALQELADRGQVHHAVVITPNNPTAERAEPAQMENIREILSAAGGWLLVDEAFVDASPGLSLAPRCSSPGLIVLRSVGKFFGLAGLRLGFVLALPTLTARLAARIPPWSISHPARWLGGMALADRGWQSEQRSRLVQAGRLWRVALGELFPRLAFVSTAFFSTGFGDPDYCQRIYCALGTRGVLVRIFEPRDGLGAVRFGLPAPEVWERCIQLLGSVGETL